jgi:antitoxin (DNA-binding transcriptional repressor) of toxin-antitoxin stability system
MVNLNMREIAISQFKATCLAVLEDVRRTRRPVRVTRFGKPIAEVIPPKAAAKESWLGCMRYSLEIRGDIVGPVRAFRAMESSLTMQIARGYAYLDLGRRG